MRNPANDVSKYPAPRPDHHPAWPGTRHPLTQAADPVSLTLYNGQHKEVGDAVAKAFEAKTGIHVNVRKGSSNQLASQVVEEGDRSPADVIYTEESPPLNKLGEQGVLAKADDTTLAVLPKDYVAADGTWIGVTARVRVVAFNPKLIDEKDLPKSVMEFSDPKWQGKVGFVPTSGAFQEQAVAIIKVHGMEAAEEWLTGLRAFGKTYSNNMVALKAVENGEVATVLVNNYYWFACSAKGPARFETALLHRRRRRRPDYRIECSRAEIQQTSKRSPATARLHGQ